MTDESKQDRNPCNEVQLTPEEEAFELLLEEKRKKLSSPALNILNNAKENCFRAWLGAGPCLDPEDDPVWQLMLFSATELSARDCAFLLEIMYAAKAAAYSIDPNDRTPLGYKSFRGDFRYYYNALFSVIEEMLDHALEKRTLRDLAEADENDHSRR